MWSSQRRMLMVKLGAGDGVADAAMLMLMVMCGRHIYTFSAAPCRLLFFFFRQQNPFGCSYHNSSHRKTLESRGQSDKNYHLPKGEVRWTGTTQDVSPEMRERLRMRMRMRMRLGNGNGYEITAFAKCLFTRFYRAAT